MSLQSEPCAEPKSKKVLNSGIFNQCHGILYTADLHDSDLDVIFLANGSPEGQGCRWNSQWYLTSSKYAKGAEVTQWETSALSKPR